MGIKGLLLGACLLAGVNSGAEAAVTYQLTWTGVVTSGTDTANLFGGGDLTGKSFTEFLNYSLLGSSTSNGVTTTSISLINSFMTIDGRSTSLVANQFVTEQSNSFSEFIMNVDGSSNFNKVSDNSSQGYGTLFTVANPQYGPYSANYDVSNAAVNTGMFTQSGDSLTLKNYQLTEAFIGAPEPATWGMMIIGFGAIGFGLRGRGRKVGVSFN